MQNRVVARALERGQKLSFAWFVPLLIAALALSARAQNEGASFLKIGVGARALGMGSAFTAKANDASAMFWNPAGTANMREREVALYHTEWVSDVRYDVLGAVIPVRNGSLGFSAAYLSQGDLEKRDITGEKQGSFGASDAAATLSYARRFSTKVRGGVNVKYIQQSVEDEKASGLATDWGAQMRVSRKMTVGGAVMNLGRDMKFLNEKYKLPLTLSGGAAFSPNKTLTFAADLRQEVHGARTSLNMGTEYIAMGRMSLRAGYQAAVAKGDSDTAGSVKSESTSVGGMKGLGFGLGLNILGAQMDYAILPKDDFGSTHHLSLSAKF